MEIIITLVIAYILFVLTHLNTINKQMKLQDYKLVKFKKIDDVYCSIVAFLGLENNIKKYYKVIFFTKSPVFGTVDMLNSCREKGIYFEDLSENETKTRLGSICRFDFNYEDFMKFGYEDNWDKLLKEALEEQMEYVKQYLEQKNS